MDTTDIEIFKKLLENPRKSFLKISKEIGIAPITVQKKYESMKKSGVMKPCLIIDLSKIGYAIKACFLIKILENFNGKQMILERFEQNVHIFLWAETVGEYDKVALGYFKDLSEIRKESQKLMDLPEVESVAVNITDEVDFPLRRDYNPLQIFELIPFTHVANIQKSS